MPILLHKLSDNMLHRLNDTHTHTHIYIYMYIYIYICIYIYIKLSQKHFENMDNFYTLIFYTRIYSYINNCPTRCNTKQSIYYSASLLYMFRVPTTPIIRSTQNCNYNLRYSGVPRIFSGGGVNKFS